jgi:hypothetical protein
LEVPGSVAVEWELTVVGPGVAEALLTAVPDVMDSMPELTKDEELENTPDVELVNVNGGDVTL